MDQISRFFQYVRIPDDPFNECFLWTGWVQGDGYGRFRTGGRGSPCKQSHRFMWEWYNERPITEGYEIDHTCEVRNCLNPLHLIEVTPEQNKSQRFGRRRQTKLEYTYSQTEEDDEEERSHLPG